MNIELLPNDTIGINAKVGDSCSKNFVLKKRIETLDELWKVMSSQQSLFARHRVYPTAFYASWQIRMCVDWLARGWFWTIEKK